MEFKKLEVSKDEIDYLSQRWEIRDTVDLFSWGAKILYDLSKLDEGGWLLTLSKGEVNNETKIVNYSQDHKQISLKMEWLAPTHNGFARLPTLEVIEKISKIKIVI